MDIVDPRVDPSLVPEGSKARIVNGQKNEYRDLTAVITPMKNGSRQIITRWSLTDAERAAVLRGEDVYVTFVSAGVINPFFVTVGPVDWNT